jgi:trans-aconitate methyltransferase
VDLIVAAMVAANRTNFGKILDLPCGGGRVTRHLHAVFPDATIFMSELDTRKEDFVVEAFNVQRAPPNPDFDLEPTERYDLVFCDSLLTHLDAERIRRRSHGSAARLRRVAWRS